MRTETCKICQQERSIKYFPVLAGNFHTPLLASQARTQGNVPSGQTLTFRPTIERWVDKKILHTGKEGYPTIVYNVSFDHAGMAHHVTSGTYGSCNDKSIIRMDTHIGAVRWFTENVLFYLL